jgi:hypothetical protein
MAYQKIAPIYFLSFVGRFFSAFVFMSALFAAGADSARLLFFSVAYSLASFAVFITARFRLVRLYYPLLFPLMFIDVPEVRLLAVTYITGLLGAHISSVLPTLVEKEALGRVNSNRSIIGAAGDLAGIAAALFVPGLWLYPAAALFLLAFLLPRPQKAAGWRWTFSVARLVYANSLLLGVAFSLTPALMAKWASGDAFLLAFIYTAPAFSSLAGGLFTRALLKPGRELALAVLSNVAMAFATSLLGFVRDPAAAWALALARWLFMISFGISLATFIQTRWRGDLMAIFTTDGFTAEVGRLAGLFWCIPWCLFRWRGLLPRPPLL